MNPGPVEEVGKVTGTFMGLMKDQPLSLALVVMNIALLALFGYITHRLSVTRADQMEKIFAHQDKVNELLIQCSRQFPKQGG